MAPLHDHTIATGISSSAFHNAKRNTLPQALPLPTGHLAQTGVSSVNDSPRTTPPLSPTMPKGIHLGHDQSSMKNAQLALAATLLPSHEQKDYVAVELTGHTLTLADVVGTGRSVEGHTSLKVGDSNGIKERIDESVLFLKGKLDKSLYGVTTGFGGSADTRTQDPLALQISLLEHQLSGVLPSTLGTGSLGRGFENVMPKEVVRGAMLIRVNSLCRGHSAVRLCVLETLLEFLEKDITPVVPLRGSISASGDLSPLSYIAGAITGHPDVKVTTSIRGHGEEVLTAPEALKLHGIAPVIMGPKEGLGLVNGTAVSASMATMALHDAHFLALLTESVTAMTVEAMVGHNGSFHPFIHDVTRPHPGQIEAAHNIRSLLLSSSFAVQTEDEIAIAEDTGVLRQDRYPLRTAAQWLGPTIEDLIVGQKTLETEINSTTDNPLVDVSGGIIHHGGNFQAMAVTSVMEKTRLGIQHMGKLSFTQMTELVNCTMNRGLPSCLAAEDPSTSYHVKGLDIAAAAYTAELGYLANPVSTHVQPAEMANQAVNSLALVSARKTVEALDVLTMLLSTHLYCACQALDLRYLEFTFRDAYNATLLPSLTTHFHAFLSETELTKLALKIQQGVWKRLETTTSSDLVPRWNDAYAHVSSLVLDALVSSSFAGVEGGNVLKVIAQWREDGAVRAINLTRQTRDNFFDIMNNKQEQRLPTIKYMGRTSSLYTFIRQELGVLPRRGDVYVGKQEVTVGSGVSKIYESIKSGRINRVLVEMMMA